jgi:polysaccharide biosynthesis transport protein
MSGNIGERSPLSTYGLSSLRRRWRLIAAFGALLLMLGLAFNALRPERYTSTTQLLVYVREPQPGPDPVVAVSDADLIQVENEVEIIRSPGMLAKAADSLSPVADDKIFPAPTPFRPLSEMPFRAPTTAQNVDTSLKRVIEYLQKNVKVRQVGASHTILVSVTTSDPYKSSRIANAIGEVAVQARVGDEQQDDRPLALQDRLQGLGPKAYLITTAYPASHPDGPKKVLVLAAALILGLGAGSTLALILDLFNRTVRTAAQVEHFGLECIGAIPNLGSHRPAGQEGPPRKKRPPTKRERRLSAMRDQTVRRTLAAIEASEAHTVGVTSAVAGEGATTIAGYLAQMANICGKKALLVQADWGQLSPRESNSRAASITVDERAVTRDRVAVGDQAGLDILNIPHVDGSPDAAALGKYCGPDALDGYDLVLVDLPPLNHGPEFRLAAQSLGGFLVVIEWGKTEFDEVERAIAESGVPLSLFVGAVLNMMDDRMIGKFGDKFWEAEAILASARRPFEFSTPCL